jgi:hypothetical protein
MFSITITITDHTAAAQSLYTLLSQGSQTGYTVAPSAGYKNLHGCCRRWELQADPANGAGKGFVGDAFTANDGSRQGRVLQAGDLMFSQDSEKNDLDLTARYLRADTDGAKFNLCVEYA